MNIDNLTSQLRFINRIGQTLSTEEVIGLQSSVLKLSHEYQHQQFQFWGRIQGSKLNYYVVAGVNFKGSKNFPSRKYFWSSEDFKFAELAAPRKQYISQVQNMTCGFSGQHEKIVLKGSGQAKRTICLDGQELVVKTKNFTELDRLSIMVHLVDQCCQVVPLGAYKMLPTHELIRDPCFKGLKMRELGDLQNFVHLRAPEHKEKQALIECDKALERSDFLDSIGQDCIKKSWSLQTDESKTEVTVRSMLWPGYLGYHRANSQVFGGVYMGSGVRCEDFPFLS